MKYDYDVMVIGMGPAGMAVAAMASEMGLKVCAVEKHKLGGECMNVGCIPSKALLAMAKTRNVFSTLKNMELDAVDSPAVRKPFNKIRKDLKFINDKKTVKMFEKVDLLLNEGEASFIDDHALLVGEKTLSAKKIFICTGSKPAVPPIDGIKDIKILTNENVFSLKEIPDSMIILGGGAIGCELAQAFTRLGSKVSIVHMDPMLIPAGGGDRECSDLLEKVFQQEGIAVYNARQIEKVGEENNLVTMHTDRGETLRGRRLLVAAGRRIDVSGLRPENAGVEFTRQGITVNKYLQTSRENIYAAGDCNGYALFSHAAMHQGMIALINSLVPRPFKRDFRKYVIPWTVFTEPQISHVGKLEPQLIKQGIGYEVVYARYEDYGAAIAENIDTGFVKAFISRTGRILGVRIAGEGSGEMINEWGLAIQKGIRITDIMFLQHSFPTMAFLNKRIAETWAMNRMESPLLKRLIGLMK
ncbi:MAG TPA: NAD(P)/FAD-dependent oxidoreductase [Deltaproteobacteria bacterium]|nr:NAD(P)/FAD-dependent oxidoreductase [Deltaproteobacteria bacterium]HPJ92619.1 NAD(P)/FAD-dependent oxidoreductase [Deltaproteobacteria bacterium]HPR51156.1 NAD(P)/FAD-dependent oxidoreductase [Deltaproteobacteria bacterium]